MQKLPGYVGKKYDRIDYAIRCKITGKYFRYCKDSVNGENWEWITGINKASVNSVKSTAEYVICKFKITNCEIVETEEYETFKKGQLYYRRVKE